MRPVPHPVRLYVAMGIAALLVVAFFTAGFITINQQPPAFTGQREFTGAGDSVNPANSIRLETGIYSVKTEFINPPPPDVYHRISWTLNYIDQSKPYPRSFTDQADHDEPQSTDTITIRDEAEGGYLLSVETRIISSDSYPPLRWRITISRIN